MNPIYMAAGIAFIVVMAVSHYKAYSAGHDSAEADCNAYKAAQVIEAEKARISQQEEINKVAQDYAAKAKKERIVTRTIIKEVDKHVPDTLPMLPAGFRLHHDAAATGQEINDTARVNGSPIAPKDVAHTVAENYANCRYDQGRLEALQGIVKAINGE